MGYLTKIRAVGLRNTILGMFQASRYYLLYRRYHFEGWHWCSPFYWKPYKKQVVQMVNDLRPRSVVEIGCGLGEIIARIKSDKKIGGDIDNAVIQSARSLYPHIAFVHGGLEIIKDIKNVDVVICINWPHSLPSSQFIAMVDDYCKGGNVGCLLIDTVNRRLSSEASHHYVCPDDLRAVGKIISSIPSVDGVRTFNLVALR